MRLTRFSDNALRCLIFLAGTPERTATVGEVARSMAMSEDHLLKVIRRLVALGYVRTIRGRKGGVRLARPPGEIGIADVVRATEDHLAIVPCFENSSGGGCPIAAHCDLAGCIQEALDAFFAVLARYTLADLVGTRAGSAAKLASSAG